MERRRTGHGARLVLLAPLGDAVTGRFTRPKFRRQTHIRLQQFVHVRHVSGNAIHGPMEHQRPHHCTDPTGFRRGTYITLR